MKWDKLILGQDFVDATDRTQTMAKSSIILKTNTGFYRSFLNVHSSSLPPLLGLSLSLSLMLSLSSFRFLIPLILRRPRFIPSTNSEIYKRPYVHFNAFSATTKAWSSSVSSLIHDQGRLRNVNYVNRYCTLYSMYRRTVAPVALPSARTMTNDVYDKREASVCDWVWSLKSPDSKSWMILQRTIKL